MKFILILIFTICSIFALVDINRATSQELMTLKNIGVKKAERILAYRKSIKCFKTIDELINVKGIGKKTIFKNRDNLKITLCDKKIIQNKNESSKLKK